MVDAEVRRGSKGYTCKNCGSVVNMVIKKDGLCIPCYRKEPQMAERIRASKKISAMKAEDAREKAGLCIKCSSEKETSYLMCNRCREKAKSRYERSRDEKRLNRIAEGVCAVCGHRSSGEDGVACKECNYRHRHVIAEIVNMLKEEK